LLILDIEEGNTSTDTVLAPVNDKRRERVVAYESCVLSNSEPRYRAVQ